MHVACVAYFICFRLFVRMFFVFSFLFNMLPLAIVNKYLQFDFLLIPFHGVYNLYLIDKN